MTQYAKLVSEFQTINRRSFPVADDTILDPHNVRPLIIGEFLQLDSAYKMARGGDNTVTTPGTPDNEAAVPSFMNFAEQGRYETQAIKKVPILYLHWYEMDTMVMDGDGLAIGDPLAVFDIDAMGGTIVRRGLAKWGSGYKIGYVTRLPAANGGYLRFIRMG